MSPEPGRQGALAFPAYGVYMSVNIVALIREWVP